MTIPRAAATTASAAGTATTGTTTATAMRGPGASPPTRLSIASIGVDAAVRPVVEADASITVPDDVATVGWWVGGAVPGSARGSAVLVGHVDSASQGAGALFHLDAAHPGDTVTVTEHDAVVHYHVTGLQVIAKTSGLPTALFDQTGPAKLVLITCGGPFDHIARSYLDNIVVTAAPV